MTGAGEVQSLVLQLVEVCLLFAAVLALAYYTTRYVGRRFPGLGVRHMRLIEQLPLGPKRAVCLVRVAGRVLVIGATDAQVTLLQSIDDPAAVAELTEAGAELAIHGAAAAPGPPWPSPRGFAAHLAVLGAASDEGVLHLAEEDLPAALRGSLARLRELRGRQEAR